MNHRSRRAAVVLGCLASAASFGTPALGQGSVIPFGSGCAGGHGVPAISLSGEPEAGGTVRLVVTAARPDAAVVLLGGLSDESSRWGPLPLDVSALPAFGDGCALLTSAERRVAARTDGSGRAEVEVTLPIDPEFQGYFQFRVTDAEQPVRYALTGGLAVSVAPVAAVVVGTVVDATSSTPLGGVRVTAFTADLSIFREARTGPDGGYTLPAVPAGSYRIGAALRGYDYVEIERTLSEPQATIDFALSDESQPGRWSVIGDTGAEFLDATDIGIVTADGRILYCHDTTDPILFDPRTGTNVLPPSSPSEQGCMNATLLQDGRILFVGGQSPSDPGSFRNAVPWVKTYSVDTGEWRELADLQHDAGRWYPGLARLADGAPLVMGGGTAPDAERTDTTERFDPVTETWSYAAPMNAPNEFSPAALLYTGEVLRTWYPPELYDPGTDTWRPTGTFVQPERFWPGHSDHSLVVLSDGRALILGVSEGALDDPVIGETYDPATGGWSLTANSALVRKQAEVVYLPDGRVLVAGGETEADPIPVPDVLGLVRWTDLYDPAGDSWRRVADMLEFREYHAISLLVPDGRVIVTGGTQIKFQYGPTSADIEAYEPPYLFRGVRPQVRDLTPSPARRGDGLRFDVFPDTRLTDVVLMGLQSHTHWVDAGVPRRVVLEPAQTGTEVRVSVPTDPNLVPAGHYMLFAMVDDIPSAAVVLRIDP